MKMIWSATSRAKLISCVTMTMVICSSAKVADDLEHALGELGVKSAGGLVEEQHVGVQGQGARDGHALLLAAGEFAGNHVLLALQAHLHQQFVRLGHDLVLGALLHVTAARR